MLKTYLSVVTVVLSLVNACLSFTAAEKQELFLCRFNETTTVRCNKRFFQTISSVTYAFRGLTSGCPSRDGEGTDECSSEDPDITSGAQYECQDKLSCRVKPPEQNAGQATCSNGFLNVSYDCSNLSGYMGCFELQNTSQVFSMAMSNERPSRSIQQCLAWCRSKYFILAGLDSRTCRCGNGSLGILTAVSTSECNATCAGENLQQCGGNNSIDIYSASVGKCGGDLNGNSEDVVFSPGYPRHYPNELNCTWLISVPEGKVIKVDFYQFNLVKNETSIANSDFLYLRNGSDVNATLLTSPLTGNSLPSSVPTSSSNTIWMKFVSNSNVRKRGRKRGFIMKYTAVNAPSTTVKPTALPGEQSSSSQLATTSAPSVLRQTSAPTFLVTTKREVTPATAGKGDIITPTKRTTKFTTEPREKTTNGHIPDVGQTASTGKGDNSITAPTKRTTKPREKATDGLFPGVGQTGGAPPGGRTLPVAIGAAVGVNVLVLTAIIVTVVIVMKRRRNPTPVPPSTSPKAITDVTTDVTTEPEPTYDTIREEEEGGVQLALSGATCSYSAIGQPNVTSGPDRQVPVYSKPDKNKANTPRNVEDLYAKPNKKESGQVENVLYESAGDLGDNVLYASADEI